MTYLEFEEKIYPMVQTIMDIINNSNRAIYNIDDYTTLVVDRERFNKFGKLIYDCKYVIYQYGYPILEVQAKGENTHIFDYDTKYLDDMPVILTDIIYTVEHHL